jgi:hypothetical protein
MEVLLVSVSLNTPDGQHVAWGFKEKRNHCAVESQRDGGGGRVGWGGVGCAGERRMEKQTQAYVVRQDDSWGCRGDQSYRT